MGADKPLVAFGTVQKTYSIEPATAADHCSAEIDPEGLKMCQLRALVAITISTVAMNQKTYKNRAAFCGPHISKRYKRWFKISY